MNRILTLLLSCFFLSSAPAGAQPAPVLTFTSLASGLSSPLDIVRPPASNRLFIVEQGGTVRIWNGSAMLPGSFLNISSIISTGGERGLLSMAFHPDYATNRYFFVFYTNTSGDLTLARYQTLASDSNTADPASGVVVKTVPHPTFSNHNGGKIIFGTDGFLYWSTGDGGSGGDPGNNAQDGSDLLGKMLRLNVTTSTTGPYFTAPTTNPFVGTAGFDSLVYHFGLRNPFRWSFDRLTGAMWIADVGQGAWEEVDYTPAATAAGRDWGWRCREGAHVYSTSTVCSTGYTDPVFEYDHSFATGGFSITGGYVYRGALYPSIYGRYICADYVTSRAFIVSPDGAGGFTGTSQTAGIPADLAGFGEDAAGELYAVSLAGALYAVSATGTPLAAGGLLHFEVGSDGECAALRWDASEEDILRYTIEESREGKQFTAVGSRDAQGKSFASYTYPLCDARVGEAFYRLRMTHADGSTSLSAVVRLTLPAGSIPSSVRIYPVPLQSGAALHLQTSIGLRTLRVMDASGRLLHSVPETMAPGVHDLMLPALPAGLYLLRYEEADGTAGSLRFSIQH